VAHEAGLKKSNEVMFVGRRSELCGQNIFKQDLMTATSEGGVVEAFVCDNSAGGHVAMMVGGGVELWKGVAERVSCEYFNRSVTEVGGDCLLTSPITLF
jgi:hypothetical protein